MSLTQNITYSLPTKAQWEYAARGGSVVEYSLKDYRSQLEKHAWYEGNSGGMTHDVASSRQANGLGLYDMVGNVQEWTNDVYEGKLYSSYFNRINNFTGYKGPNKSSSHIICGCDWNSGCLDWGLSYLYSFPLLDQGHGYQIGFRLVRTKKINEFLLSQKPTKNML